MLIIYFFIYIFQIFIAHPVRFSALPEIARNKFIEAGCPIILQCEISDPTAQVSWLKDGVELQQDSGLDIQSEGTMKTMIIHSAELKHSGVYSCEAVDDRIAFKVDVAGDFESTYFFSKPLTMCQITLHPLNAVCPHQILTKKTFITK